MWELTSAEVGTAVLAAASAIVLLVNAAEKIIEVIRAAKAPNAEQNKQIAELQDWKRGVDQKLSDDKRRLDVIDQGNRATQRALLALLDHGIDGNNIEQMQHAKEELQNHLINR